MLQQLGWDIDRDLDPRDVIGGDASREEQQAFWDGLHAELRDPNVVHWVVDEVMLLHEELKKGPAQRALPGVRAREARRHQPPSPDDYNRSAHTYDIEVVYPDERFARKHESQVGHIIGQPLVSQGALLDGYRMEYGPIDRGDYRRLEGLIYTKLGNAVRVRLVQVMYGAGRADPRTWAERRSRPARRR
jgi:hypothetical protein